MPDQPSFEKQFFEALKTSFLSLIALELKNGGSSNVMIDLYNEICWFWSTRSFFSMGKRVEHALDLVDFVHKDAWSAKEIEAS